MSKIRLNVESLAVDSFATDESARERGTVEAQQVTATRPLCPASVNYTECSDPCWYESVSDVAACVCKDETSFEC